MHHPRGDGQPHFPTSSDLHVILDIIWYLSPHFPVKPGQEVREFSSLEGFISRIAVQLLMFSVSSVLRILLDSCLAQVIRLANRSPFLTLLNAIKK